MAIKLRRMKYSLVTILLCYTFNFFGQNKSESIKQYDLGVSYFKSGNLKEADSLFKRSIESEPNADTYYNEAVVNKMQGDLKGYCENLDASSGYGDNEADKLYTSDCLVTDSFFVTENYKKASIESYFYKLEFIKSKYTSYQAFYRYDNKGKLDLAYEISDNDTAYISLPKPLMDSVIKQIINPIYKIVQTQIKYPSGEKNVGVSGTVFLQFYIDKFGNTSEKIKIIKAPSKGLALEAAKIIRMLPQLKPIVYEGKAVKIRMILPVMFSLR